MKHRPIRLVRNGNCASVVAGDVTLMRLTSHDLFMAGLFQVHDVRFHPERPVRFRNLQLSWNPVVPHASPQRVRIGDEATPHGVRLRLIPETQGPVNVDDVYEFLPDPITRGWMIEHRCRITFKQDLPANSLGFSVMQNSRGVPTLYWEWDDPLPMYGVGPSVPMKEDWINALEPNVGPYTFRKQWRQEVEGCIFQEPSGKTRTIPFHRGILTALMQNNRRAVPYKAGGFGGFVFRDGAGVLLEFLDRHPACGHVCEWGNDLHFWQPLDGDPDKLVLRKGDVLERRYLMRELPAEKMKTLLKRAVPIKPTRAELKPIENLPIYEEPVNHFATPWSEAPARSAYCWVPGLGATWDRKVGRTRPGSLKLTSAHTVWLSDHDGIQTATWKSPPIGPSTFMNPLVPNARYRLSGYVRVRPFKPCFIPVGPRLSITFHKYVGPGTYAPEIQPPEGFGGGVMQWKPDRWYKIEVVSGPITGNVLSVTLGCHLSGHGEAWFDEIAFEKI